MANKKQIKYPRQIHPLIDEETEETFILFNIKPSQALKGYAKYLRTDTTKNDAEIFAKKEYLKLLECKKQDIDNEIDRTKKDIETLEKQKNKSNNEAVSNYKKAIKIIDEKFDEIENALEHDWNVQRMTIKELESISIEYCIPPVVLLAKYPRSKLKRVLKNYRKYA